MTNFKCMGWTLLIGLFFANHTLAASDTLTAPSAKLHVVWQSYFSEREKRKLRDWLSYSANSASLIQNKFPRQNTRVFIKKYTNASGPVPWAHTIRHTSPQGVSFYVDPSFDLKTFKRDWTAVHEFSHLHIPYLGKNDRWLAEGFASYYQNVLMARAGSLTTNAALNKLKAGFSRAQADGQTFPLSQLSNARRIGRMRVYWSGALYFLEMDVMLRQQQSSLDQVIREFINCCRSKRSTWNGEALVSSFSKISGESAFVNNYHRYRNSNKFPDPAPILANVQRSSDDGDSIAKAIMTAPTNR